MAWKNIFSLENCKCRHLPESMANQCNLPHLNHWHYTKVALCAQIASCFSFYIFFITDCIQFFDNLKSEQTDPKSRFFDPFEERKHNIGTRLSFIFCLTCFIGSLIACCIHSRVVIPWSKRDFITFGFVFQI